MDILHRKSALTRESYQVGVINEMGIHINSEPMNNSRVYFSERSQNHAERVTILAVLWRETHTCTSLLVNNHRDNKLIDMYKHV